MGTMSSVDHHRAQQNIRCTLRNRHLLQSYILIEIHVQTTGLSLRLHKVNVVYQVQLDRKVTKVIKVIKDCKEKKVKKESKAKEVRQEKMVLKGQLALKVYKVLLDLKVNRVQKVQKVSMGP